MMFAGTSGVLSHTLAHAPMASAAINAVVVHRVHRVNTTARDTFRATRRRVERATRRARDAIAMDDALDRDARRDRVVDVDVDERAPMLASTPSTAGARGARANATRTRAIGACAIVGMVGAVTIGRARARAGATATTTATTLGMGQDLAASENARGVYFEVDARCPPDDYVERHADFFRRKIVKVTMVDKCAGETGWNWEFNLGNPETAHEMSEYEGRRRGVWHANVTVDNRCEYGFVLTNELGEKRWEIGGDNVDTPLEDKGCSSEELVGGNGNVYNNRLMRDWPDSDAIRWAWGRCLSRCPATSRLYAMQHDDHDGVSNLYTARERYSTSRNWTRVNGVVRAVSAGYEDVWIATLPSRRAASERLHATIHDINENATGTSWESPENLEKHALAGGKYLDVGREHTWFVSSDSETWRASGTHGNKEFVKINMQVAYAKLVFEAGDWVWVAAWARQPFGACRIPCDSDDSPRVVRINFPGVHATSCSATDADIYCVGRDRKVYRASTNLTTTDDDGNEYTFSYMPPLSMWTEVPLPSDGVDDVAASLRNIWVVDDGGDVKRCSLPCDGNWLPVPGLPAGKISAIVAGKFNEPFDE